LPLDELLGSFLDELLGPAQLAVDGALPGVPDKGGKRDQPEQDEYEEVVQEGVHDVHCRPSAPKKSVAGLSSTIELLPH
jgi:hypothetical protein